LGSEIKMKTKETLRLIEGVNENDIPKEGGWGVMTHVHGFYLRKRIEVFVRKATTSSREVYSVSHFLPELKGNSPGSPVRGFGDDLESAVKDLGTQLGRMYDSFVPENPGDMAGVKLKSRYLNSILLKAYGEDVEGLVQPDA